MNEKLILAYDVGTTTAKASVIDISGKLIASAATEYSTYYPHPGEAEQDPDDWWNAVRKSTSRLIDKIGDRKRNIAVIGVSGHMLGCLAVDRKGQPLRRSIIHSDSRAISQWKKLKRLLGEKKIYEITGNRIAPQSTLCKIYWLKENESEIYKKTSFFLQSKDYLTYKLTGQLGNTDYSDASHTVLLDINKKIWSDLLLEAIDIDKSKLPEIRPSADIVGRLTKERAKELNLYSGIPVVIGGGDGACASVGAGAVKTGQSYICLGGTAWVAAASDKPFIDSKMRLFNILDLDPAKCGVFGTMQTAGSAYEWLSKVLQIDFEEMNKLGGQASVGSKGLFFLPYLMGERSPVWDPYARALFFGLDSSHRREEIIRAVLEGIGYALKNILEVFEEKITIKELRLIGGGVKNEIFCRILTDILGKRLLESEILQEATSYGAAMAAGVGCGLFRNYETAAKLIKIKKQYLPDEKSQEKYENFFEFYKSLYPKVKSLYHSLYLMKEKK